MRKIPILCGILVVLSAAVVAAQEKEAWNGLFSREMFEDGTNGALAYRLMAPAKLEEGHRYPLVLFLHGAGERGDDNNAQLLHGMREFASDAHRQKFPAWVVAPQCPAEKRWVDVDWSRDQVAAPAEPGVELRLCHSLIESLSKQFPVDRDRVYVCGLSMGGFGTYDAVARWPELFAAAAPICGGSDISPEVIARMKQVPMWIAHGDADATVPVSLSRDVVAALKEAGAEPHYVEMAGVGHDSWSATFADEAFLEWLFAQNRRHNP
jgi:predicted peptidase